jgi:catechol 2,3-dioxygenase-like lactoylglutathione lyase family enzyme
VTVIYRVQDFDAARSFYRDVLGLDETYMDAVDRWSRFERGRMEIVVAEGEPEDGGVATLDVADAKAEAERLKAAGVEVGVVLELHGQMRLVDVFDADGNRIQLAEELSGG